MDYAAKLDAIEVRLRVIQAFRWLTVGTPAALANGSERTFRAGLLGTGDGSGVPVAAYSLLAIQPKMDSLARVLGIEDE